MLGKTKLRFSEIQGRQSICFSRQAPDGGGQDPVWLRDGGGGPDEQQALHVRDFLFTVSIINVFIFLPTFSCLTVVIENSAQLTLKIRYASHKVCLSLGLLLIRFASHKVCVS